MSPQYSLKTRIFAYLMVFVMCFSSFFQMADIAHADVTTGSTGSISSTGATNGLSGGIKHIDYLTFRVGVVRDEGLRNPQDGVYVEMRKTFSHRFPKNKNGIFMVADAVKGLYSNGNYEIAWYNSGQKKLETANSPEAKARVVFLQTSTWGTPYNTGRDSSLNGWSFGGEANYAELVESGEWKKKADETTREHALAIWSYILAPTGGNSDMRTYDIKNRADKFISPNAGKKYDDMTKEEKEEVFRGFLGLLFAGRAMTNPGTPERQEWDSAIEDAMRYGNLEGGGLPVSIVIDTALTVSYTGGKMTIIPSLDYFMFYTSINSRWDLYNTTKLEDSVAGNTHKMLDYIVDKTIEDEGSNQYRISNAYDKNNPFSHGSSAIAYPGMYYSTSAKSSGTWKSTSSNVGAMDVLIFGANPNGSGNILGFIAISAKAVFPDPPPPPPPGCPEDPSKCLPPKGAKVRLTIPSEYKAPYRVGRSETIGVPTPMELTHDPSATEMITSWKEQFIDNQQMIIVKITEARRSSTPKPDGKANLDRGAGNGFGLNSNWFIEWLEGKHVLKTQDIATINDTIEPNTTRRFDYMLALTFYYTDRAGQKKEYTYYTNSDYAEYIRDPDPPKVDPIIYTSSPSAYAEFKDNQPDQEQWDAMSGVPSNKRLYVGVGGSEFIVDIQLEYKEDVDSVWRTYRSYFTGGVPDEFKEGDTAKPFTLGGYTVDPHNGGVYTKTWTGTIPNKAKSKTETGSGNLTVVVPAEPDMTEYNRAKQEAQAYVNEVNAHTQKHTSASDKVTRSKTGWNARITTDNPNPPKNASNSGSCWKPLPEGGSSPCAVTVTTNPSPDGNFTITVTFEVPAHYLCGPNCLHILPGVEDTWKQKVTFDYMKILKVEVYKIQEGRITQVKNLLGDNNDTLKATIRQGDPTIFYNIAEQNANGDDIAAQSSKHGRIRYSLDWNQHDTVVYNEGPRSNKSDGMGDNGNPNSPTKGGHTNKWATGILYNNTKYTTEENYHRSRGGVNTDYSQFADDIDVKTAEWKKFDARRKAKNVATIISDMLILQTSSGDQAVIYFEKDSTPKEAQQQFDPVKATKEEMWDDNPNSAAKWEVNQIYVGSYNGKFMLTGTGANNNQKYWGLDQTTGTVLNNAPTGERPIATKFDSNGAGVNASRTRPARPSKLYIWNSADIIPTTQNGLYTTGDADVFYKRILSWESKNTEQELKISTYRAKAQPDYGNQLGVVVKAPYSDMHSKVNDVVIHTPVAVENAMIISLPDLRDQRVELPPGSAANLIAERAALEICPLDPELCEFRVLNCRYHLDEELARFDFTNTNGTQLMNLTKGAYINTFRTGTVSIVSGSNGLGSGNAMKITGQRLSFNLADLGVTNLNKDVVSVEMDIKIPSVSTKGRMLVSFDGYTLWIPANQKYLSLSTGKGADITFGDVPHDNTVFKLRVDMSLGSAKDTRVWVNGSERTATLKAEPNSLTNRIGSRLHIGTWVANENYEANFTFDNLKIVKKGGTDHHTEACYIYTQSHDQQYTHTHTSDCWGVVNGVTTLICNNYPLNTLSQNNVHVHDANCIHYAYINSIIQKAVEEHNANLTREWAFNYTGNSQVFTAPSSGTYLLEVWGAQGGGSLGGKGGYSKGKINLSAGQKLYVYVGGTTSGRNGGWNGGGSTGGAAYGGGGGTDMRFGGTGLEHRIIVAGGGGGAQAGYGGYGGGMFGGDGEDRFGSPGRGGSQSSGGSGGGQWGTLGQGGSGTTGSDGNYGGAGGGGYYGGGGANSDHSLVDDSGGGGGSGYIGGVTEGQTIAGNQTMPAPSGGTQTGHSGHGFARITLEGGSSGGTEVPATDPVKNFSYTGSVQTYTVPATGKYQLEVWGAQGGGSAAGKGGYAKGEIYLTKGQTIRIYVGGQGSRGTGTNGVLAGGWNGGGDVVSPYSDGNNSSGGGATDIRVGGTNLSNRVIVAGGGGGVVTPMTATPHGGGTSGLAGTHNSTVTGTGGTQTGGGTGNYGNGELGKGANGSRAGAGGGYYGGGTSWGSYYGSGAAGGGGSGYIGGVTNGTLLAGDQTMPNPSGGTMTGRSGNGYARITPLTKFETSGLDISTTGMFGYTWAQLLGSQWSSILTITDNNGFITATLNQANLNARANTIPKTMPDGSSNPFLVCMLSIGGYTSLGAMEGASLRQGASIVDQTYPGTNLKFKTIKLASGSDVPTATSKTLNLKPNAEYIVEFSYWTSGGTTKFNVDLYPDMLPEHHLTASSTVKKAQLSFKSGNANMANAALRFFNDLQRPNPTDVYITGIRIYPKPIYNAHEHNESCRLIKTLDCTEPHHIGQHYDKGNTICWDACGIDENHKKDHEHVQLPGGGSVTRSNFINLDYTFTLYFPNRGNFAEQPNMRGISTTMYTRGYGYTNNMDTTQYTAAKRVRFDFHVIYNNKLYRSGTWIDLPVNQEYFEFYLPLANKESVSAQVQFEAVPINGRPIGSPFNENYIDTANRARYAGIRALHGAYKQSYIDVVGRVGNFAVMDTEDFRFSNLFKEAKNDGTWQVEGLVPTVDPTKQNRYYGDLIDIRGVAYNATNTYLDTYGNQSWKNKPPLTLPVNALDNTIPALQGQYLKIGYDILADLTTIGDYQNGLVRVLPYYYKLDLDKGTITPLDVYTKVGDEYKPINKYRAADNGTLPTDLAPYNVSMSWSDERERRNYSLSEATITERITNFYEEIITDSSGENVIGRKQLPAPAGSYTSMGNAQRLVLDKKMRTFIGSSATNGVNRNPGNVLPVTDYDFQAQRWHLKFGVPSSAVFVPHGMQPTLENIESVKAGNSLILLAADIVVLGDVYTLRYQQPGVNSFTVSKNGVTRTFSLVNSGLPPVIAIYDTDTSSIIDIATRGSH